MSQPKLVIRSAAADGAIASHASTTIQLDRGDGSVIDLRHVKRLFFQCDAEQPAPTVELVMYTQDFRSETTISERFAEAIVMHERWRELEFLSSFDAVALRRLLGVVTSLATKEELSALSKVVDLLNKREEALSVF
jgi:hypothetical protein